MLQEISRKKINMMRMMLFFSVILMAVKFFAYLITDSNAILTDAFESIINVIAGTFALFSIYFSSRPKDADHPYGHGKIESLSAGFEGGMIFFSGLFPFYRKILALYDCFITNFI